MSKLRKIILGSCMALATAISLASTTYAFVVINKEVEVELFDFNLESETGMLISLDGANFSQDITLDMLKTKIKENTGVEYESVVYDKVTLSQTNGLVDFDSNGLPIMVKDSLVPNGDEDNTHHHEFMETESDDYLQFDLYFRAISQGSNSQNFQLKFKDNTSLTGTPCEVKLSNSLNTKNGPMVANDIITVNPVDAMRLGVVNHNDSSFVVYEPSIGLASAAIEGSTDDNHNKDMNAMYTYYNNQFPLSPFEQAAEDGEGFDTLSTFTDNVLGEFVYDQATNSYNDIKLTVVLWLEGWDADFFVGIPTESTLFKVKLAFELVQ